MIRWMALPIVLVATGCNTALPNVVFENSTTVPEDANGAATARPVLLTASDGVKVMATTLRPSIPGR